jgi:addiction module RelE/StbE family toxin
MKLIWTPPAAADRREIRAYIAQDNPAAALALDALFAEKASRLIRMPHMGRPGRVPGTRELVAHRHYLLIYDVTGDLVRVLRVMHTARQWPPQEETPP